MKKSYRKILLYLSVLTLVFSVFLYQEQVQTRMKATFMC